MLAQVENLHVIFGKSTIRRKQGVEINHNSKKKVYFLNYHIGGQYY